MGGVGNPNCRSPLRLSSRMRWRAASRLGGRCGGATVAMDGGSGIKGGTEFFCPKGEGTPGYLYGAVIV